MKYIKYFLVIILVIFIGFSIEPTLSISQTQQFIRFHVIANSDSYKDQSIKLKVRDRLLTEFGTVLGGVHSLEESRRIVLEEIGGIEEIAQREVNKHTSGCHVQAKLGHYDFPTKAYGDLVMPAGNYEALRIVIGEGEGANWWCVMFPPLCFVDISHGIIKEETNEDLDNEDIDNGDIMDPSDSTDPIEDIGDLSCDEPIKIEYKFKIVEWLQEAKDLLKKTK